jgi:hypothetical protein
MRSIGSLVAIAAILLGVGVAVAAAGQSSSAPVLGPQQYPVSDQVGFGQVSRARYSWAAIRPGSFAAFTG